MVQMNDADLMRLRWAEQGNPPCDHPEIVKEYDLGSSTGDKRCTTCGAENPVRPAPGPAEDT
ncbi:hypothetical protein CA984_11395 [Streptosporangium minutum]|uniref:Uncharacterized protein n=1 Tax=Streptosporangium minutum TaxID=569862 RepID=A0A243RQU1_9ACTN|nr:hypothetical protein CA984_11395 [Streptosporangium minutum]